MAADTLADPLAVAPAGHSASLASLDAGTLDAADIAAVLDYAERAKAANTRLAYASDWRHFSRWAAVRGATPLPCPPGLLCAYLAAEAEAGRRASTITRRAAAIAFAHRARGYEPPTTSAAVREVLRGIRHTLGTAPEPKLPATAELVLRMLAACPTTSLIGLRDRALLAFGFAGAFRRAELLALTVADLTEVPDGLRVRRSPFPTATGCARSRHCKPGWPPPQSAPGRCSVPSARAAGSATDRSVTTASPAPSSAAPPPSASTRRRSAATAYARAS
jgi:hypothetical protein